MSVMHVCGKVTRERLADSRGLRDSGLMHEQKIPARYARTVLRWLYLPGSGRVPVSICWPTGHGGFNVSGNETEEDETRASPRAPRRGRGSGAGRSV
jgi:hypothetical protein